MDNPFTLTSICEIFCGVISMNETYSSLNNKKEQDIR